MFRILCKLEWSPIALSYLTHPTIPPTIMDIPQTTLLAFLQCIASPPHPNIPLGSLQPPTSQLSISDSPHWSLNTHWRTDGHLTHTKTSQPVEIMMHIDQNQDNGVFLSKNFLSADSFFSIIKAFCLCAVSILTNSFCSNCQNIRIIFFSLHIRNH